MAAPRNLPGYTTMRRMLLTGLIGLMTTAAPHSTASSIAPAAVPARLQGSWSITRILPTSGVACFDEKQAEALVHTPLVYSAHSMRWKTAAVPLHDVFVRELTADEFQQENSGSGGSVQLADLGIRAGIVTEVDLQHEDMDITGATTEVPGDTVLLAAPNRIVVRACNVFYEATHAPSGR